MLINRVILETRGAGSFAKVLVCAILDWYNLEKLY